MRRAGRRGISGSFSAAIGFILAASLLSAAWSIVGMQAQYLSSKQRAVEVEAQRGLERLRVGLAGGNLTITNAGPAPTRVSHLVLIGDGGVEVSRVGLHLAPQETRSIPLAGSYTRVVVVTGLGNTFTWGAADQVITVTFDVEGLPPGLAQVPILMVDGVWYTYGQLPQSFTWPSGSSHSYRFASGPIYAGQDVRWRWTATRGLAWGVEGVVAAERTGSVIAEYRAQYRVDIRGPAGFTLHPSSPTNDGWYDAGTILQVSAPHVAGLLPGQSRLNLLSYTLNGALFGVARAGAGSFTTSLLVDRPLNLTLNYVRQYYVELAQALPSSGPLPSLQATYSYMANQLGNPGFEAGSLPPWSCVGNWYASGCGTNGEVVVTRGMAHGGSYSAYAAQGTQLVCSGSTCWFASYFVGLSQAIPISSTTVRVSGWLYVNAPTVDVSLYAWSYQAGQCTPQPVPNISPVLRWTTAAPEWRFFNITLTLASTGCLQIAFQNRSTCDGWCGSSYYGAAPAYFDDITVTYTTPEGGVIYTTNNSYTVSGDTVTYQYTLEYSFPSTALNRQLRLAYPSTQSLREVRAAGSPTPLPSGAYTVTGNSITIPEATIASYGGSYTIITQRTGSHSATLQPSPTRDNWYDEGSTLYLSAASSGPFTFLSWAASSPALAIPSPASPLTTLTINGPGVVTARFDVQP